MRYTVNRLRLLIRVVLFLEIQNNNVKTSSLAALFFVDQHKHIVTTIIIHSLHSLTIDSLIHHSSDLRITYTEPSHINNMGVKGLLPCLQSITRQVSLEKYRGLSVAVDAMCWLHKGIFTGNVAALAKYQFMEQQQEVESDELLDNTNEGRLDANNDMVLASTAKRLNFDRFTTTSVNFNRTQQRREELNNIDAIEAMSKCIDYVIRHSIELQKTYGLDIISDGDSLPSKRAVDEKRRLDRADAFQRGLKAEKRGDSRQARKYFSRACSISYKMRHELIIKCKQSQIPFIVAPYEADAQMAKLALTGEVDLVITEDSDLLAYGCPRVLFKIDFKAGNGEEIQLMRDLASNEPLSFRHWNHDMFVYMCILAGCDYCEGVSGVGIQTAHKIVRIHRKPKKIIDALIRDGKAEAEFEESFQRAYKTFRHQRVFCSQKREATNLFEMKGIDANEQSWDFLGPSIESSIARGIVEGKLHPREKKPWEQVTVKRQELLLNLNFIDANNCKSHDRKRLPFERSPIGKENVKDKLKTGVSSPNDKNLFSFFRPKKRNNNDRPPLQEVHINENMDKKSTSFIKDRSNIINSNRHAMPSSYYDYNSRLVSGHFEPISRNHNSRLVPRRKMGVSKALRELKQKLSSKDNKESKTSSENKTAPIAKHDDTPHNITGLNLFRKVSRNNHDSKILQTQNTSIIDEDYNNLCGFRENAEFASFDHDNSNFFHLSTRNNAQGTISNNKVRSAPVPMFRGFDERNHDYLDSGYDSLSVYENSNLYAPINHDQFHSETSNYTKHTQSSAPSFNDSFCGFEECLSGARCYYQETEYVNDTNNNVQHHTLKTEHYSNYMCCNGDENINQNVHENQSISFTTNKQCDGSFEQINHFLHL